MKIKLLLVGKTASPNLAALCDDYSGRISHYLPFSIDTIPALAVTRNITTMEQSSREGTLVLRHVQPTDYVALLDERGKSLTSEEFARWLNGKMLSLGGTLVFVVGGPYGFSPQVRDRADSFLSLSPMTFPHQMVRLIFLEQLYRALTIIRGQPYHHG